MAAIFSRRKWVNSLKPGEAYPYMQEWIGLGNYIPGSTFTQAHCLFCAKPLSAHQGWFIMMWTLQKKVRWNFKIKRISPEKIHLQISAAYLVQARICWFQIPMWSHITITKMKMLWNVYFRWTVFLYLPPDVTHTCCQVVSWSDFTNNFSIIIQIPSKFHAALVKWSLWNFAHDMTAVLSWHVQNFIAIWHLTIELHWNQLSIEFEFWRKNLSVKWAPGTNEI